MSMALSWMQKKESFRNGYAVPYQKLQLYGRLAQLVERLAVRSLIQMARHSRLAPRYRFSVTKSLG